LGKDGLTWFEELILSKKEKNFKHLFGTFYIELLTHLKKTGKKNTFETYRDFIKTKI